MVPSAHSYNHLEMPRSPTSSDHHHHHHRRHRKPADSLGLFPKWLTSRQDFAHFLGPIPDWRRAAQKKSDQRSEEELGHLADWVTEVGHFDHLGMKPMEIAEAIQYKVRAQSASSSDPYAIPHPCLSLLEI